MEKLRSREATEFPRRKYDKQNRPSKDGRSHHGKSGTAQFIAWDGEGYSSSDGEHHYMLFGNSLGRSIRGESLTWRDCFPLLLEDHGGINVIYGGHYDVVMMTKSMPFPVRDRLYSGRPVKYGGYRMVYYRSKFLLLKDIRSKKSTILYDVISFFQTSFVKACREYLGNDDTLDAMHEMKLKRDTFTYGDDNVDPYWQSELDYLVRLMTLLRELMAAVDIKPRGWYGPGAVASAVLNRENVKEYYGETPEHIVDIAERAYYGGRFEQFKVGRIERVYEYDIRSAYPSAIVQLPSFVGVTWHRCETVNRIGRFGLYRVSWDIPFTPVTLGPFPWRDERGNILFPLKGTSSWYWGVEVQQLAKRFPREYWTIEEGYEPEFPERVRAPFRFVGKMYADRARMKAEGNPAQMALKLGLNSLYGKLAQSTGAKKHKDSHTWTKPGFHNILWAGWITAYTRAKLLEGIGRNDSSIVAIETDAIFTTKPLELPISSALGDFEETVIERILYIHSGQYYALNDGVWKLKSRGVEADKSKSADYWLEIFKKLPETPQTITLKIRRFGTDIRQVKHFGRWYDFEVSTNIPNSFSKRMHVATVCPTCFISGGTYAERAHYLSVPQAHIESDWQQSTPYNFPWRDDVKYKWRETRGEHIEEPEGITWH